MRKNIKGVIIGSAGAVFLSVVGAAVYDFIRGNDIFATLIQFILSFIKLMAGKIAGFNFPVWLLLLIVLVAVVIIVTLIQRLSEKRRRKKAVRYRLVRQPQKRA